MTQQSTNPTYKIEQDSIPTSFDSVIVQCNFDNLGEIYLAVLNDVILKEMDEISALTCAVAVFRFKQKPSNQ